MPRVRCGGTAAALAGAALAAGSCGAPAERVPPAGPRHLLLITVDTLRPDALGWVGGRNRTPALDGLARGGFRFPRAVTPVPLTLPAHASLLSGLVPPRHGVRDNGQVLPAAVETLATTLRARGFATAAFVSGYPLQALFGLDRGFDTYDDRMPVGVEGWVERRASDTTAAALSWISAAAPERPWFVWIHYYDPHDPYDPPRAFWKPGPRGAYDGEVEFVDAAVGNLLAGIPAAVRDDLLTVFTADHGEALGEHREHTHGYFLYESTIAVPLVLHWPRGIAPGENLAAARLIDVLPTALELLGVAVPGDLDGASLVPALHGGGAPGPSYVETQLPWRYFGWAPLDGLRDGRFKLVRAPRPELYDLERDPGEQVNLFELESARAAELLATLEAWGRDAGPAATAVADVQALERLRALGYVGAGSGTDAPPARESLADPKDRIELREAVAAAEELLRHGQLMAAVQAFDTILRDDPGNRAALLRSGVALLKAGRLERAAERLAEAVRHDPERAEARFALADALTRSGKLERAATEWAELVRLQPRRAEGWANLASTLRALGRADDAAAAQAQAARYARPG